MIADNSAVDVVVIGGGPAGSTVSTLLAQHGCRVNLYERDRFPRFHIGESLIPETYWVFERLKMLDKMKASPFVKKYSVQFVSANGKVSAPFNFWDNKPHECSQTWQVIRSEFDTMMLDNAREQGVKVHQPARVLEVLFEGDQAVGVRIQREDGGEEEVRAQVVVDGSGQSTFLQNRFKLRLWDPVLNKGAIWTYWEGAYRAPGQDGGATLVVQTPNKQGWWWYIPQHDHTVSVGVVAPFDYLFKGRGGHEKVYDEEVEACPAIKERISIGRRAAGYFATKDYSYRAKEVAGAGWVLVGDAFGFLDPLYSSGVLLALKSGELAADAIAEGLAKRDVSAAQLGKWGPMFNKGVDRMRRLVCEYYDGFSFGTFVRTFPHLKGLVTDLLIGDLFTDRVDAVWEPMESLYGPEKKPIPAWTAEAPPEVVANKVNELFLPEDTRH
ncbi:MAG TPA: NAD(P)/FAD-dependent oxidoreductase [Gemmataceae bacterium]|nr:NAD(P)/FAD-dependent oxidoreductase [Gemmataceae bacterium]